jgi:hypothetical protein
MISPWAGVLDESPLQRGAARNPMRVGKNRTRTTRLTIFYPFSATRCRWQRVATSEYHVFPIANGHVIGASKIVHAPDDREATRQAEGMFPNVDVELWEGPRRITTLKWRQATGEPQFWRPICLSRAYSPRRDELAPVVLYPRYRGLVF